jgi:hypothetical protein
MTKKLKPVAIAPELENNELSKAQKTFNQLIKQIEKRRATLMEWEAVAPRVQQRVIEELLPLANTLDNTLTKFVQALDHAHGQKGLTKAERNMLSEIIAEVAGNLAEKLDDEALKAIYNRHADSDFDLEQAAEVDMLKQATEDAFGIDLGDDVESLDDLIERTQNQFEQRRLEEEAREQARKERQATRKKNKKATEEKARMAREQTTLSLREVYRKLASSLHPDRETDLAERERKTALMQQVNQAYEKNDLLKLLELQLELEHIDQAAINNISEGRLQQYNKILKEQIGELDSELAHVQERFCAQFGLDPFAPLTPRTAERSLSTEIAGIKSHIRLVEVDTLLCHDLKKLKANVKRWHREISTPDFDEMLADIQF